MTRSVTCESSPPPRVGTRASISSKKTMQGAACLALRKTSRTPRSDSPTYFDSSDGPLTEMKLTCVWLATALASSVLPQPGRPAQQDALGRPDAGAGEHLGVLERPLDRLDQPLLDLVQPADVVPAHVGKLDEDLADRRRLDLAEGGLEVGHPDLERAQGLVGDLARGEVDRRQEPAQAEHGGLAAEGLEVGADEAVGDGGEVGQVDVGRQRHPAAVDLEDLLAAVAIGDRDGDLAVEPARAAAAPGPARWAGWSPPGRSRCWRRSRPSSRPSSCATTRFSTSPTTRSRWGAMASISSMKMMLGACFAASSKILRRCASLSP